MTESPRYRNCEKCCHPDGWHSPETGCRIAECSCKWGGPPRREKHHTLRLTQAQIDHLRECVDLHLSFDCDEEPARAESLREIQALMRKSRPR